MTENGAADGPLAKLNFGVYNVAGKKKNELAQLIRVNGGIVNFSVNKRLNYVVALQEDVIKCKKELKEKHPQIEVLTEDNLMHLIQEKTQKWQQQQQQQQQQLQVVPAKKVTVTSASKAVSDVGNSPSITLLLPATGPNTGGFKVAVFGLNFHASSHFRVAFGNIVAIDYEFHSPTAVVCTLPASNFNGGECNVVATNDGVHFGFPISFKFLNPMSATNASEEHRLMLLKGQLQNLHRAILNIQSMETVLQSELSSYGINLAEKITEKLTQGETETKAEPIPATNVASRKISSLKDGFDREIRIFISSPFRDMQEERDQLVKIVIPQLRKFCMERDVICSYVDLRWGVTGVQSELATMLLMCLRELDSSNLFVGLYGERYGWSVQEKGGANNELLNQSFDLAVKEFAWINQYRDRSVTEVEMRMILERQYTGTDKQAWFYLRDKYYVEEVPQKDRHIYSSEGPQSEVKLATLKKNIEKSPFSVQAYHRPSNIAELVYSDLIKHIEKKFPKGIEGSLIEKERFQHAVYLRTLCRTYLPREEYFHKMDGYVASVSQLPLTIIGESGIGKSALCANWIVRHCDAHPEDFVLYHFVGCSPSLHFGDLLWRIMMEVKEHMKMGEAEKIPDATNIKEIQQSFPDFMKKAMDTNNPKRRRLVLIIDGLNKLDNKDNATELLWLPKKFPTQVRVLLTTTFPNRYLEVLRKRGSEVLQVEPLPEAERKSFLRMYLNRNSKRLSEKQEFNIAKVATTANPRFLQTLLDDISVFGDFEQLETRITRVLSAKNTSDLYEIVLERLEKDYDPQKKGVVRHFVSLIWASRRGLPLDVLGRLLEKRGIMGQNWSALFIVMEDFLSTSGLMAFTNGDIKLAIKNRYFIKQEDAILVHKTLADYYLSIPELTESKLEELPYQLWHARQYDQLAEALSDMQVFDKLYTGNKYDLFGYWRDLEQISPKYDVVRAYSLDENYSTSSRRAAGMIMSDLLYDVGCFLEMMAKYAGAEKAYTRARDHYRNSSQYMEVAKTNSALAQLYHTQGRNKEAEAMLDSCLEIYLKQKGEDCMEVCVNLDRLGSLYTTQKRFAEAKSTLQRAMRISETHFGVDSLIAADVAYSLGVVHLVEPARKLDVAEQWFQRALSILESHYGDKHTDVANVYNRLGTLYIEQDQFNDAEDCLKKSLAIREKWLGARHSRVAQTLRTMMSLYEMQERYREAIECGTRALEITKSIFGNEHNHAAAILLRLGILYYVSSKPTEGKEALAAALAIRQKAPANEAGVKEVLDLIESFEHPEKQQQEQKKKQQQQQQQQQVKPPPPPPAPKSLASLMLNTMKPSGAPGGIPPPPPPPPPCTLAKPVPPPPPAKQQVACKSNIGGALNPDASEVNDATAAILRAIKLRAGKVQVKDRSDARENALAMLGGKQQKMVWKKSKK